MPNRRQSDDYVPNDYGLQIPILQHIVELWETRRILSEEVDYIQDKQIGGDAGIESGLVTNFEKGINNDETGARRSVFGSNDKDPAEPPSFWAQLLGALNDFTLIVLIICAFVSIIINMTFEEDKSTAWIEGAAILFAVAISSFIGAYNDYEKELKFQDLNAEAENGKKCEVIRSGFKMTVTLGQVVVGDVVIIKNGMEIAGDGYVIEACMLEADESSLTGETEAMKKDTLAGCVDKKSEALAQGETDINYVPSPILVSGSRIVNGEGKYVVLNVGPHSAIGKIQEMMEGDEEEVTPLQMKLETIARDIGNFGLYSAVFTVLFMFIRFGFDLSRSSTGWDEQKHPGELVSYIVIGITIIVVAIPEGLPLAVTLSLAYSVKKMLIDHNLVRKLAACETMGGAQVICTDKTGTLTQNKMSLDIFWNQRQHQCRNDDGKLVNYREFIPNDLQNLFVNTICVNSSEDPDAVHGLASEIALLQYLKKQGVKCLDVRKNMEVIKKIPFSSTRKRGSIVVKDSESAHGKRMYVKGASEIILRTCSHAQWLDGKKPVALNDQLRKDCESGIYGMATKALRTIAVAYKDIKDSDDLMARNDLAVHEIEESGFTLLGIYGIRDTLRPGVKESIRLCRQAGVKVRMVTGDNEVTARAIALECGIMTEGSDETCMEGPVFWERIGGTVKAPKGAPRVGLEGEIEGEADKKDEGTTVGNLEEFKKVVANQSVMARSRPKDKYALVTGLRQVGQVVAVTGDGTNDAPALSKADVGFAMGICGTDVAKGACDIMLMDDNFNSIINAIVWGRNIYDSIRKFLQFQLTVNVVAVVSVFISACILRQAMVNAVQMLWINLIMDTLASLALATELPDHDELMKRKPHRREDYIISKKMFKHIACHSVVQLVVLLICAFMGDQFLPWHRDDGQASDTGHVISGRYFFVGSGEPDYKEKESIMGASAHFTYIFNIFVCMQITNFVNARKINDELNVLEGLSRSKVFCVIVIMICFLQWVFITFGGRAIGCVGWGLDRQGWYISIGIGCISFVTSFIVKFLPEDTLFPCSWGAKETDPFEGYGSSALGLRRTQSSQRRMSAAHKLSGTGSRRDSVGSNRRSSLNRGRGSFRV